MTLGIDELAPGALGDGASVLSVFLDLRDGTDGVQSIRPRLRIARRRATQHGQSGEAANAGTARGLEPLTSLDREEHGGRKKSRDRDDGDAESVLEPMPADVHHDCSGTNQPTTRPFSLKTDSAAARTSSAVTAARRSYHSPSEEAAPVASS